MVKISLIIFVVLILIGVFYASRQLYIPFSSNTNSVSHNVIGKDMRFNSGNKGYRCGDGTEFNIYSVEDTRSLLLVPATDVEHVSKTILSKQEGSTEYVSDGIRFKTDGNSATLSINDFTTTCTQMPNSLTCHDSPKYFSIEKSLAPAAGSDILIKYKNNPDQDVACEYITTSSDFELKNAMAEYFLAFTDSFLILDKGTAPEPRILEVYDLRSRKLVFTDSYAKPVTVTSDTITYFSRSNIKPTMVNCPDLKTYMSSGLGAVIMSQVTVDLQTLARKNTGENKCIAIQ